MGEREEQLDQIHQMQSYIMDIHGKVTSLADRLPLLEKRLEEADRRQQERMLAMELRQDALQSKINWATGAAAALIFVMGYTNPSINPKTSFPIPPIVTEVARAK